MRPPVGPALVGDTAAQYGNTIMLRRLAQFVFIAAVLCVAAGPVRALDITLERPGDREFIRDRAEMIAAEDEEKIRKICDTLLTEKATPIIVVTIQNMAAHGGEGMRIETFARLAFDQWEIGQAKVGQQIWNTGVLLLVSRGDRKARIELGAGWKHEKDELCQQIMDGQIIPRFKDGKFSAGIASGVEALDLMAREKSLPRKYRPWWHYALIVVCIGLAVFTIMSLIRRGASGWAWLFWGALFAFGGYMLYSVLTSSSRGGGGGFGGGSFGGGFSGGGGATGSW